MITLSNVFERAHSYFLENEPLTFLESIPTGIIRSGPDGKWLTDEKHNVLMDIYPAPEKPTPFVRDIRTVGSWVKALNPAWVFDYI